MFQGSVNFNLMQTKIYYLFWLALALIAIIFLIKYIDKNALYWARMHDDAFRQKEFNGIILDKYIDPNEHQNKTIILMQDNIERTIIFNLEKSGIYGFFEIGDSIIKDAGTLQIRVIRHDLDSVLEMEFSGLPDKSLDN